MYCSATSDFCTWQKDGMCTGAEKFPHCLYRGNTREAAEQHRDTYEKNNYHEVYRLDDGRENAYKKRLIALCEGLELQYIDKMLLESPEHFNAIGKEITRYAKIGAEVAKILGANKEGTASDWEEMQ